MAYRPNNSRHVLYGCVRLVRYTQASPYDLRWQVHRVLRRVKPYGGAVTMKLRPYWLIDVAQALLLCAIVAWGIIYLMNIPTSASTLVDGPMVPVQTTGEGLEIK